MVHGSEHVVGIHGRVWGIVGIHGGVWGIVGMHGGVWGIQGECGACKAYIEGRAVHDQTADFGT